MKIVIATTNEGKLNEIRAFLEGEISDEVRFLSLMDFSHIPEVEEKAKTIKGNALIKARAYSRALGLPVIAEDSALEVEALGGAPGVYSSRYGRTDEERIRRLLRELSGVPLEKRVARFRCVMVLALPSKEEYISEGSVEGYILDSPPRKGWFWLRSCVSLPPAWADLC